MLHVCIVGPDLTSQHALIERLRPRHAVTLLAESTWMERMSVVAASDALAMEADGENARWRAQLKAVLANAPGLPVILVDGELTEEDKAEAFALGALDFFPALCPPALLAERLEVLAQSHRAASDQLRSIEQ